MPCKIQINQQVTEDITRRSTDVLYKPFEVAEKRASQINSNYGYNVISFREEGDHIERRIHIPQEVIEMYYDSELKMEKLTGAYPQRDDAERAGEDYSPDYLLQIERMNASKASPETIAKVKQAAKKMGIDLQKLSDYVKGNPEIDVSGANALADLLYGVIAIAEGKEDVALTEEMVHIATAILNETNPSLVTELISKIDRFKIYKQTLEAYKNNPHYKLSDGRPDIRKIKKEAVDKLIAELIINQSEGSTEFPELMEEINRSTIRTWWQKILDWFRGAFKKTNIELFQDVAEQVMSGEVGARYYNENKEGVDTIFKETPELAKIGTPKQYSAYLESIFPNSKYKNIAYHGTRFDIREKGFDFSKVGRMFLGGFKNAVFFTNDINRATEYAFNDINDEGTFEGNFIIPVVLNINNPKVYNTIFDFNKSVEEGTIENLKQDLEYEKSNIFPPVRMGDPYVVVNFNRKNYTYDYIFATSKEKIFKDSKYGKVSQDKRITRVEYLSSLSIEDKQRFINKEKQLEQILNKYKDRIDNAINLEKSEIRTPSINNDTDAVINTSQSNSAQKEIAIFDPSQIHIMGSQQDIEGFKNFMSTAPAEFKGKGLFLQQTPQTYTKAQLDIQKKILDTKQSLRRVESTEAVDPLFMDTEEASNWYETRDANGNWVRVPKRVTDRVKAWYKQKFFGKAFTEEEKKFNELKRTLGIKFHKFMEEIHGRYFNEDGTKRLQPDARPSMSKEDEEIYNKLENYFVDMIESLSKDGKIPLVFAESMLYDPTEKEAGTLDLFIVDETGKAHILDWKFMSISEKSKDVPWFKKGAFNIQLGRYKDILRDAYGIKSFGLTRAIPVLLKFEREDRKDPNSKVMFTGIKVGSVDPGKIEDLRLLPVAEKTESTGEERLDEIINKLNAVYNQISKSKTGSEIDRQFKSTRLNLLEEAIRKAQIQGELDPLIKTISEIKQEGKLIQDDYNMIYKDKNINSEEFTDRQLSDFADRMREYIAVTKVFGNVTDYIGNLIYDINNLSGKKKKDKRNKETLERIKLQQDDIRVSELAIHKIAGEFADRFIGQRNREVDLLSPEAVIKSIGSTFAGVADLPLASLRILYKLVTNAKGKASRDSLQDVNELVEIRKRLAERGGDLRKLVQTIYQKDDKGKIINKLVYQYDEKFYDEMKNNALEGHQDRQWFEDNVDMKAYEEEYTPVMEKNIEHLKAKYGHDRPLLYDMIQEEKDKWIITRPNFTGWTNYILRRHPKSKWLSKEYLEIKNDPDMLALYDYVKKINERASEAGYIQNKVATTFLPFVRKTMAESLAWDLDKSGVMSWDNMMQSLTIDASTVGYGAVNELTGELEHSVPKYFTSDFTKDKETGEIDTSDLSEDLFKNLIMYTNHVNKYIYLTAVEGQLKLVKDIEEFKDHWVTSQTGKVDFENGKPVAEKGNAVNFKLFDDFLRGVLYDQKYALSDTDMEINTGVIDGIKKAINQVTGVKIFNPSDKPSAISLVKSIDMVNRGFQLKTLGFEFISGAVNAFGGNIQVLIQAGNYFRPKEFLKNEAALVGNKFKDDDERQMFLQLIEKFMPLKDDPTYDLLRESGMSALTRTNFTDWLMVFMRDPEQHIEKSIFLTLLQNMMVVDGKIVSIREFVKNKYKDRYASADAYSASKNEIEAEIEELKNTKSIDATKQLVDGKLSIPGLDLNNSNELQRLTNLTRRISRHATGGISDSDINKASMNIWLRSMMVFKMWIPKLLATRFSHFERTSDDFSTMITEDGKSVGDKYDIGRIRLWGYVIGTSLRDKSMNVLNILNMNEKGILALDKMYEDFAKGYRERTGKEMNMSKEDFNDMILDNLRNQMREVGVLLSLFGATLAMGMMKPPDDADRATKNAYRFALRVMDKFKQEVSFFYNPVEFEKLLSGGTFPAIGLFSDITRFTSNFLMETTGLDITNPTLTYDEVVEKAQPIKYFMKMLPVTKSAVTYGAMISSDFAKEFDITVSRGNTMR